MQIAHFSDRRIEIIGGRLARAADAAEFVLTCEGSDYEIVLFEDRALEERATMIYSAAG